MKVIVLSLLTDLDTEDSHNETIEQNGYKKDRWFVHYGMEGM